MTGVLISPQDLESLEKDVRSAAVNVIVMLDPTLPPVTLATMRAAIAPLAVACAPARRINAMIAGAGVRDEDLAAARDWLSSAESTTGQVLELSPQD